MKFIFLATSLEIYLFCTFIYFPFLPFFHLSLQVNEHRKGVTDPLVRCAVRFFNFLLRFLLICLFSIFIFSLVFRLHRLFLRWLSLFFIKLGVSYFSINFPAYMHKIVYYPMETWRMAELEVETLLVPSVESEGDSAYFSRGNCYNLRQLHFWCFPKVVSWMENFLFLFYFILREFKSHLKTLENVWRGTINSMLSDNPEMAENIFIPECFFSPPTKRYS